MKNRLLVNVTRKESMTNIKPDILYYDLIGSLSMYWLTFVAEWKYFLVFGKICNVMKTKKTYTFFHFVFVDNLFLWKNQLYYDNYGEKLHIVSVVFPREYKCMYYYVTRRSLSTKFPSTGTTARLDNKDCFPQIIKAI